MPSLVFPSTGMQVLSSLIHFLGVTVLTHCISRRLAVEDLTSFSGLSQISWPRLCTLLVFVDSWLFLFSSGVLIFGVGLELSHAVCSMAILFCIGFYATSKLLIYAFLIERVHIVWSPIGVNRFRSRVYIICFVTVAIYAVVITLLVLGRVNSFRDDGACVVGLRPISSIPLLSYDLYINVFLTGFFLWPLFKSDPIIKTNPTKSKMRRVATRTLIASGVALTTSTVNVLVLAVLHGRELGWVCLGSCGADVIFNASALFWVTGGSGHRQETVESLPVITDPASSKPPTLISDTESPPSPSLQQTTNTSPLFTQLSHRDMHTMSVSFGSSMYYAYEDEDGEGEGSVPPSPYSATPFVARGVVAGDDLESGRRRGGIDLATGIAQGGVGVGSSTRSQPTRQPRHPSPSLAHSRSITSTLFRQTKTQPAPISAQTEVQSLPARVT